MRMTIRSTVAFGATLALTASMAVTSLAAPASALTTADTPARVVAQDHWSGKAPTTKRMSAADRAKLQKALDVRIKDLFGAPPAAWVGVWSPEKGWAIVSAGDAVVGGAAARKADHNRIGSVTKTFVATEILKLVDAGKVELSDTIADLLPEIAKDYPYVAKVTVKKLLGMRSGIPDYADIPEVMQDAYANPEKDWTARQLIDAGLSSVSRLSGKAAYSNTNYILLGEIAKAVSGKDIWTLVNRNVRRLGLTQTRLPRPGQSAMPKPASKGYNYGPGAFTLEQSGIQVEYGDEQKDDVTQWGQAAGAMYSTVANLGRWAATGLGTNELSPAMARKRLNAKPINDGFLTYGLGMVDYGNGWIGHDGQAIGWEDRVAYNPKTGAIAVVMLNETASLDRVLPILTDYFPDLVPKG